MIGTTACRYGTFSYFRNDQVVGRSLRQYVECAQTEIDFLSDLLGSGSLVLDIGAFIGTHTLAFSKAVGKTGRVHSFEPIPKHFALLLRNIRENEAGNVLPHNMALSDGSGDLNAPLHDTARSANFGGAALLKSPVRVGLQSVPATTLDLLPLERCDLIKIDAEGMEAEILRGGRAVLENLRPIVYAECRSLESGWPCVLHMREIGYETLLFVFDAFNPDNFRANRTNNFGAAREAGLLFIPNGINRKPSVGVRSHSAVVAVDSLDALALALLKIPQYKRDVLAQTASAKTLGLEFFADEMELARLKHLRMREVKRFTSLLRDARPSKS